MELLGIVHIGLCGSMDVSLIDGSLILFLSFMMWHEWFYFYFLKHNSEVISNTYWKINYKTIKILRFNNDTKYVNNKMIKYLASKMHSVNTGANNHSMSRITELLLNWQTECWLMIICMKIMGQKVFKWQITVWIFLLQRQLQVWTIRKNELEINQT